MQRHDSGSCRFTARSWRLILALGLVALVAAWAPAPALADCTDDDGDGYGDPASGDCTHPELDCNDGNPAINPGEVELCDGIDNNCNAMIDEGYFIGEQCAVGDPQGCVAGDAGGCCHTVGVYRCSLDKVSTFCYLEPGTQILQAPEGPAGSASCFDGIDNDCDDLTDHQEGDCQSSELCNGFDDDNDGVIDDAFPGLGGPCSNGVGECSRTGVRVCSADQSAPTCTAIPGQPKTEGPPGSGRCSDGKDNDCDELTDLDDPGCAGTEICDGVDNDNDGDVDEGFAGLGDGCDDGVGPCFASGTVVCAPGGATTVCSAVAGSPSIEGPSGVTCLDTIDNDCDGTRDDADPSCGSAGITASCALPYTMGKPGSDCTGKHRIVFSTSGHGPDAIVTAELVALDATGNQIQVTPVQNDDTAHLASRLSAGAYKFVTRPNKKSGGSTHEVFAPIPMLRVTVEDGQNRAQAFCSIVPYLDVLQPSGQVVAQASGDATHVLAAIPLVNPASLFVKVDGVDVLNALGLNPAIAFPGGPYGGNVTIRGETVAISGLTVASGAIGTPSSNTLRMTMSGLGCGGHVVVVDGDKRPGSQPDLVSTQCVVDDTRDKGNSMTFTITIASPAPGEVTAAIPTPVQAEVCHGLPIASASINGGAVPTAGAILTPGDGEDSADSYRLPIDTLVGRTDLVRDLSTGDTDLGTFDPGSNRLIVDAIDSQGNRTFASLIFATGSVAAPGTGSLAQPFRGRFEQELQAALVDALQQPIPLSGGTVSIPNAFVVGLKEAAVQKVFSTRCVQVATEFVNQVHSRIPNGTVVDVRSVSGGCSCSPTVTTRVSNISIDPNAISCPVNFVDGKILVSIDLPDINFRLHSSGSCKTTARVCVPFTDICTPGVCLAETIVNDSFDIRIAGLRVDFDITEEQLEGTAAPNPPVRGVCANDASVLCGFDSDCSAGNKCVIATASVMGSVQAQVNCLASACNWILNGLAIISNAIFGTQFEPVLVDFTITPDFTAQIGASQPDPIELKEIKVDEEEVENFMLSLKGELADVEITPAALRATLTGQFSTPMPDATVPATPGAVLTPAAPPAPSLPGAGDTYIVLADDTFNQLFASMVASGKLKTGCQPTDKTVGDLLPADCNTLTGALVQGLCHGVRNANCETLSGATSAQTALKQGTCHGIQGAICSGIPVPAGMPLIALAERTACNAPIARRNLDQDQPLLFCLEQQMPPRLFILDDATTPAVETTLRLNDLSVSMIVDRDGTGLDGAFTSTPNCFQPDQPTTGDCNLLSACLDVNFLTAMQFATCADGKPGITTSFQGVQLLDRQFGVVCGGATSTDDGTVTAAGGEDNTVTLLGNSAAMFTPPICANGLTLGGFVTLENLRLIAVDTDGDAETQDYLGITGDVETGP